MRLVHREELDQQMLQARHEARRRESLGRDVQQPLESAMQLRDRLALLGGGLRAVDQHRGQPLVAHLLHLVGHQRDQRRDDDGQPALHRCGQLITQALAGTGGHDAEHIPAGQDILDHAALRRAKIVQAEKVLKLLAEIGHGRDYK